MRTHTTTNQKQAAKMKDRRERRWGGEESLSFGDNIVGQDILVKKYNKIINLGVVVVL